MNFSWNPLRLHSGHLGLRPSVACHSSKQVQPWLQVSSSGTVMSREKDRLSSQVSFHDPHHSIGDLSLCVHYLIYKADMTTIHTLPLKAIERAS